jgi:hypothetical protein
MMFDSPNIISDRGKNVSELKRNLFRHQMIGKYPHFWIFSSLEIRGVLWTKQLATIKRSAGSP